MKPSQFIRKAFSPYEKDSARGNSNALLSSNNHNRMKIPMRKLIVVESMHHWLKWFLAKTTTLHLPGNLISLNVGRGAITTSEFL